MMPRQRAIIGIEMVHVDWMRQDHDHDPVGGWRGMKRDGWEGGHRVPFIAGWPGTMSPARVSSQLCSTTDIFATPASAVGYALPDDVALVSFDMLPAMLGLQGDARPIRPHPLTRGCRGEFQIRQGNWKYLDHRGSGGNDYGQDLLRKYALPEREPDAPGQLYDLPADPGETTNQYVHNAAKRRELQDLLARLKRAGRSAPRGRMPVLR